MDAIAMVRQLHAEGRLGPALAPQPADTPSRPAWMRPARHARRRAYMAAYRARPENKVSQRESQRRYQAKAAVRETRRWRARMYMRRRRIESLRRRAALGRWNGREEESLRRLELWQARDAERAAYPLDEEHWALWKEGQDAEVRAVRSTLRRLFSANKSDARFVGREHAEAGP